MLASIPDLLRLVAVPFFGYLAYRDIKTRRVPNETWYPIAALAIVLLVWDAYMIFEAGDTYAARIERQRFLIGTAFSLFFVIPLVYGFWLIGGFGGADTKAFWVIALLFPVFPVYDLREVGVEYILPVVESNIPAFSLTILSNAVIMGVVYPFALAARNAASGYLSPGMFIAKPVSPDETTEEYGTLLSFPEQSLTDDLSLSGLRAYFSWRGLDLDALRMYLQYRGLSLAEIRESPDKYRDAETLPEEPNDPGDGVITDEVATDGGTDENGETDADPTDGEQTGEDGAEQSADAAEGDDDPWGAEAFLDDLDHSAYGTSPADLREGLEMLVGEDSVWISPGIPFLVPLFFGLLVSLTAGDLLYVVLDTLGLV